MPSIGVTYPAAGVIATRPASAPATAPLTLGAPRWRQDSAIQTIAAIAGATLVLMNAIAATPFAASALPALKPNHPNHTSAAPSTTIVRSCGRFASTARSRGPSTQTATSAATPEET